MPANGAPAMFCYKSDTYGRKGVPILAQSFKFTLGETG